MATLRVFKSIDNDVWKATFVNDPDKLSDTDKQLMKKFGEPEIQVGGDYAWTDGQTFTIPTKTVRIRTDFPFTQEFDATSTEFSSDTESKVTFYINTIVTRFTTALTDRRDTADTYTGEEVHNI